MCHQGSEVTFLLYVLLPYKTFSMYRQLKFQRWHCAHFELYNLLSVVRIPYHVVRSGLKFFLVSLLWLLCPHKRVAYMYSNLRQSWTSLQWSCIQHENTFIISDIRYLQIFFYANLGKKIVKFTLPYSIFHYIYVILRFNCIYQRSVKMRVHTWTTEHFWVLYTWSIKDAPVVLLILHIVVGGFCMYHRKCQSWRWFLCWCVLCTNSNKALRFICPDSSLVLVVGVVDNAGKLLSPQFIA